MNFISSARLRRTLSRRVSVRKGIHRQENEQKDEENMNYQEMLNKRNIRSNTDLKIKEKYAGKLLIERSDLGNTLIVAALEIS